MHSALTIPSEVPNESRRQHGETAVGKRVEVADAGGAQALVRRHPQRAGAVVQNRERLVARAGRWADRAATAVLPRTRHTVAVVLTHIDPCGPATMARTSCGGVACPGHAYGTSSSPWTRLNPPAMAPTHTVSCSSW